MRPTEQAVLQTVDQWLDEHYPQMEQTLCNLLRYATVEGEAAPGAPFGPVMVEALATVLDMAQEWGFNTENLDNYLGLIDWPGAGEEQVGILTHLDVVPAIEADWHYAPYAPIVDNGRIYGRGAMDNKGPLVAILYAMTALKESGLQLGKTVRHIIGCNEEGDFKCMEYFLAHREPPSCGFSPDGDFPAVIGEKGMAFWEFRKRFAPDADAAGLRLIHIKGGTAGNVIPAKAEAMFAGDTQALFAAHQALPEDKRACLQLIKQGEQTMLLAIGESAHASQPELGANAVSLLLSFLRGLSFAPADAGDFLHRLGDLFVDDSYGSTLGVAAEDALSKLTCCPNVLQVDTNGGSLCCDMRFPISHRLGDYRTLLAGIAKAQGFEIEGPQGMEPHNVAEDTPLVQALLGVYREMTGDDSPPLIIGGGSYARFFQNFIAFGPGFPGEPMLAHKADEYINQERLSWMAKFYARAIYRLCT